MVLCHLKEGEGKGGRGSYLRKRSERVRKGRRGREERVIVAGATALAAADVKEVKRKEHSRGEH